MALRVSINTDRSFYEPNQWVNVKVMLLATAGELEIKEAILHASGKAQMSSQNVTIPA